MLPAELLLSLFFGLLLVLYFLPSIIAVARQSEILCPFSIELISRLDPHWLGTGAGVVCQS